MGGRCNVDNVHNWQLKLFRCSIINAGRCCASINQCNTRDRFWQRLSLLEKLVCDALRKPDRNLNTWPLAL